MRFENYQAMSIVPTLVGMIVEPNLASNQDCPRLKTLEATNVLSTTWGSEASRETRGQFHFEDFQCTRKTISLLFLLNQIHHRRIGEDHQTMCRGAFKHEEPECIRPDFHQWISGHFASRGRASAEGNCGDDLVVIGNGVKFVLGSALKSQFLLREGLAELLWQEDFPDPLHGD